MAHALGDSPRVLGRHPGTSHDIDWPTHDIVCSEGRESRLVARPAKERFFWARDGEWVRAGAMCHLQQAHERARAVSLAAATPDSMPRRSGQAQKLSVVVDSGSASHLRGPAPWPQSAERERFPPACSVGLPAARSSPRTPLPPDPPRPQNVMSLRWGRRCPGFDGEVGAEGVTVRSWMREATHHSCLAVPTEGSAALDGAHPATALTLCPRVRGPFLADRSTQRSVSNPQSR